MLNFLVLGYVELSLNPHQTDVWESLIRRGRGKFVPQGKLAILAILLHSRQQISYQGTLKTQWWTLIGSRSHLGPLMDPTWTLKWTSTFSSLLQAVFIIYILYTPAEPPYHVDHFIGHCGTLPRLRGPSSTFMDPQMEPKMDPPRLISGDPL